MNIAEFDTRESLYDNQVDGHGAEFPGKTAAQAIKTWLTIEGRKLNPGAKMLGLGAGAAKPELELARYFGIPDSYITLVEKQPLPQILERLKKKHSRINYHYGEGLYHFLQNTSESYDLVTAFLLHHLLDNSKHMSAFITLLSQKVRPGGIVCVYPYAGEDLRMVWNINGFAPFYPGNSDPGELFYTFKGKPK